MDFISDASFWIPDLIVESGWIAHAPFAFWLTEALRPETVVELGTYRGYSYFVFNQAIKRLELKTRSFAIDTWAGDEHAGFFGNEVIQEVQTYNDQHYWDFSELVQSTFDDARSRFPDGSIDLLHIDGRHFHDDVTHDFETWKGALSECGVVLIHDTNVRVHDFGVYRVWKHLSAQYPSFEFLHGHGLGLLAIGEDVPENVRALCEISKSPVTTARLRNLYSRLGTSIPNPVFQRRETEPLQQELTRVREELSAIVRQQNEELRTLTEQLRARDEQLQAQDEQLRVRDEQLQSYPQQIQELNREIRLCHEQVEKLRDEELTKRSSLLESFGNQTKALKDELEQVRTEYQEYRDLLDVTRGDLQRAEKAVTSLSSYKTEYEKAVSSRSWKITKPLRDRRLFRSH